MAGRVVLHIGTMKSGTSFVQSVLGRNKELLADRGARYVGGTFPQQVRAVRGLLKLPKRPEQNLRKWNRLAQDARSFAGEVGVVSMEFMTFMDAPQVDAALRALDGLEVEVVVTVRDQFRAIPAQWQTFTRNRGQDSWASYLEQIQPGWRRNGADSSRAFHTFHRAQNLGQSLQTWSAHPAVARTTVVTVPPPGSDRAELWNRFASVLQIDPSGVDLSEAQENASIGYASCEYLRLLNVPLERVRPTRYREVMRPLIRRTLAPLRDGEPRPELSRSAAGFACDLNASAVAVVREGGYRVIGDLDELPRPRSLREYPSRVAPAPAEDVLRAARTVWADVAPQKPAPEGDLVSLTTATAREMAREYGLKRVNR